MTDVQDARVNLGGTQVDLMDLAGALARITERAVVGHALPLAVVSANLDHLKHFGVDGTWAGSIAGGNVRSQPGADIEWLSLLDGAPLVAQTRRLTGRSWPRLAGSDLIEPLLDAAMGRGIRVGFMGGAPHTQALLQQELPARWPDLEIAGWWAPERSELTDSAASRGIAAAIADAKVDLLVVGLGKPRQELWIAEYGMQTGANVLLAFGAVVDFLAGRVTRAPAWVSDRGLEWAWRLALEPRRLARRYLVDGPPAYLRLRLNSSFDAAAPAANDDVGGLGVRTEPPKELPPRTVAPASNQRRFVTAGAADVLVYVRVDDSDAQRLSGFLATLREETADLRIGVVLTHDHAAGETPPALEIHPDVLTVPAAGFTGPSSDSAAGQRILDAAAILLADPDLTIARGAIAALYERLRLSDTGVVVPLVLEADGRARRTLRRQSTLAGRLLDAVIGSRIPSRPGWLSQVDHDPESYSHAHTVYGAAGPALMRTPLYVDLCNQAGLLVPATGHPNTCHHARITGTKIWFEPGARLQLATDGS